MASGARLSSRPSCASSVPFNRQACGALRHGRHAAAVDVRRLGADEAGRLQHVEREGAHAAAQAARRRVQDRHRLQPGRDQGRFRRQERHAGQGRRRLARGALRCAAARPLRDAAQRVPQAPAGLLGRDGAAAQRRRGRRRRQQPDGRRHGGAPGRCGQRGPRLCVQRERAARRGARLPHARAGLWPAARYGGRGRVRHRRGGGGRAARGRAAGPVGAAGRVCAPPVAAGAVRAAGRGQVLLLRRAAARRAGVGARQPGHHQQRPAGRARRGRAGGAHGAARGPQRGRRPDAPRAGAARALCRGRARVRRARARARTARAHRRAAAARARAQGPSGECHGRERRADGRRQRCQAAAAAPRRGLRRRRARAHRAQRRARVRALRAPAAARRLRPRAARAAAAAPCGFRAVRRQRAPRSGARCARPARCSALLPSSIPGRPPATAVLSALPRPSQPPAPAPRKAR